MDSSGTSWALTSSKSANACLKGRNQGRTCIAKRGLFICLAVAASLSLGACDLNKKTEQAMDQRASEAQQSLDTTQKPPHAVAYDPLTVSNKIWTGGAAIRMQRGMPLPARYEVPRGITLVSSEPMTLNEIADSISAQTGIPVRLNAMSIIGKGASAEVKAPPASEARFGAREATGGTGSQTTPPSTSFGDSTTPVSYEGTLSGLLNRISASFNVNWRFDGSSIIVSRYETRIFAVEALPGTQTVNEGMQDDVSSGSGGSSGGSGGSGGASGGSGSSGGVSVPQQNTQNTLTQNSTFKIEMKYWEELTAVLNSIVGSQGLVVVSPSMGTVTITATTDVMNTVADYLAKENRRLGRQIAINVQIYSVNLGQSEDFTLAFNSFLNNLSKIARLSYTSAAAPGLTNTALSASNFGSLSVAILDSPNSTHGPASDIFNALSAIGNTTNVAQFPMTTLNNRPVSRRVGTDTTYISTVTNTASVTTTVPQNTYTPVIATVHDGFSLQLTPRLLDDGRILLQYSLSLIGLDSLNPTSFNTGSGTIPLDLPTTDNRIFVQQSMLRSGQTLVIGGVDQEKMAQNQQGVGEPDFYLLGGGTSSNSTHLMMFMAITPQVMDVSGVEGN